MMNENKTLEIGKSDFKKIVENNYYFVDKTKLIYDQLFRLQQIFYPE